MKNPVAAQYETLFATIEKAIPSMSAANQPHMQAMLEEARAKSAQSIRLEAMRAEQTAHASLQRTRLTTPVVPKGISGGKIAAYVAAAAVVAGGIHLLTRTKPEPSSWQARIDAERAASSSNERGV